MVVVVASEHFYGVRDRGVKGRVLIWGGSTLNNESTREGSSGPEDVATLIVGATTRFRKMQGMEVARKHAIIFC